MLRFGLQVAPKVLTLQFWLLIANSSATSQKWEGSHSTKLALLHVYFRMSIPACEGIEIIVSRSCEAMPAAPVNKSSTYTS